MTELMNGKKVDGSGGVTERQKNDVLDRATLLALWRRIAGVVETRTMLGGMCLRSSSATALSPPCFDGTLWVFREPADIENTHITKNPLLLWPSLREKLRAFMGLLMGLLSSGPRRHRDGCVFPWMTGQGFNLAAG